ncbi:hypothetical protein [Pedobacter psychrophilus]|nr:hypothetical protein [Pedobacter psychrophilus]
MIKHNIFLTKGILFSALLLFSFSCTTQKSTSISGKPELIFQSGFEGTSKVVEEKGTNDYGASLEHIAGKVDSYSKKSDWDKDLKALTSKGVMEVQYTGGDSTKRFAKVIPDPTDPKNSVLQFWLNDSWLASEGQNKARVQTNLYGIKGGMKEFYQSVRVYLTDDFNAARSFPKRIPWCTIAEFWNNEWWVEGEKNGFRITVGVGKYTTEESDLHFILEAENAGQKLLWRADYKASNVAVPIGKWFTMDYYFKEGNKENGRFYLAITPDGGKKQVVYDVHDFTHGSYDQAPNGLTGYNPMKLYTSKELVSYVRAQDKTLQILWDDFKLWKNKKPE